MASYIVGNTKEIGNAFFIRLQKEITALGYPISIDELRTAVSIAPNSELFRKVISWLSVEIIRLRELKIEPIEFSYSVPLFVKQLQQYLTNTGCPFTTSIEGEYVQSQYVRNVDTLLEYMTTELASAKLEERAKRKKAEKRARKLKNILPKDQRSARFPQSEWNKLKKIYDSLLIDYREKREDTLKTLKSTVKSIMETCGTNPKNKEFLERINKRISRISVLPNVVPEDVIHVRNIVKGNERLMKNDAVVGNVVPIMESGSGVASNIRRGTIGGKGSDLKQSKRPVLLTDNTKTQNSKETHKQEDRVKECRKYIKPVGKPVVEMGNGTINVSEIRKHYENKMKEREKERNSATKTVEQGVVKGGVVNNDGSNQNLNVKREEVIGESDYESFIRSRNIITLKHEVHKRNIPKNNAAAIKPKSKKSQKNKTPSVDEPVVVKPNIAVQWTPRKPMKVRALPPSPIIECFPTPSLLATPPHRYSPPQTKSTDNWENDKSVFSRDSVIQDRNKSLMSNKNQVSNELSVQRNINEPNLMRQQQQCSGTNSMLSMAKRDPRLVQHNINKVENLGQELINRDPRLVHHDPRELGHSAQELAKRDPRHAQFVAGNVGSSRNGPVPFQYPSLVGNSVVTRDPRLIQYDSSIRENSLRTLATRDPRLVQQAPWDIGNPVNVLAQQEASEARSSELMERDPSKVRNSMREPVDLRERFNQEKLVEQLKQAIRSDLGIIEGERAVNTNCNYGRDEDPRGTWNQAINSVRNDDRGGREDGSKKREHGKYVDGHRELAYRHDKSRWNPFKQSEGRVRNNDERSKRERDLSRHRRSDNKTVTAKSGYGRRSESMHGRNEKSRSRNTPATDKSNGIIGENITLGKLTESNDGKGNRKGKQHSAEVKEKEKSVSRHTENNKDVSEKSAFKIPKKRSKSPALSNQNAKRIRRSGSPRDRRSHSRADSVHHRQDDSDHHGRGDSGHHSRRRRGDSFHSSPGGSFHRSRERY